MAKTSLAGSLIGCGCLLMLLGLVLPVAVLLIGALVAGAN